jgi:ribosomal protein S18 acetylase RimI-like enzyme
MSSLPTTADSPVELRLASQFTLKQLTIIYNQTRVDYLVPMPMNMARMTEYIQVYDADLENSFVAVQGEQMIALGMLGVRAGRTWITRLGVLPGDRRHGVGQSLTVSLLNAAERKGIGFAMLEVIKNNVPAHKLFLKLGFYEVGELLVMRRPPGPPRSYPVGKAAWLKRADALALLDKRAGLPPWTNQNDSLNNAADMYGVSVTLPDGNSGWLVFQRQRFVMSRFVMQTEQGDPVAVGRELLGQLHDRFFDLDTQIENISVNDPHLPAYYDMGYVESFRRIEMYRGAYQ